MTTVTFKKTWDRRIRRFRRELPHKLLATKFNYWQAALAIIVAVIAHFILSRAFK